MKLDSLRTLYVHELNDLHDAERQLVKALPKMVRAADSKDLGMAFELHLQQTREHVTRLERALELVDETPTLVSCLAMKGIIEEAEEMMHADGDPTIRDAGLISTAQRVEHYEMAGYGCARTYAERLGEKDAVELLQETLNEELASDEHLTELAGRLIGAEPANA